MRSNEFTIYLPVEVKVREFNSRLSIAAEALSRGWSVILGARVSKSHPIFEKLPALVVVAKSAMGFEAETIKSFQAMGHIYGVLDEEGLIVPDQAFYSRHRLPQECRDILDFVYMWGPRQEGAIGCSDDKFVRTGNPRVDLWRSNGYGLYDKEIEKIRRERGDFLLIPSTFTMAHMTEEEIADHVKRYYLPEAFDEVFARVREQALVLSEALDGYCKALANLSHAGMRVVFRPHPSEDKGDLERRMGRIAGVEIIREGSVTPWIMASRGVIHLNCTTSLEASLQGKPVIQFLPEMSPRSSELLGDMGLSVGVRISDHSDLVEAATNAFWGKEGLAPTTDDAVKQYVYGAERSARSLIIDHIEKLGRPSRGSVPKVHPWRMTRQRLSRYLPKAKKANQKFPVTTLKEVENGMKKIMASSGTEAEFKCEMVSLNLFHFSPR